MTPEQWAYWWLHAWHDIGYMYAGEPCPCDKFGDVMGCGDGWTYCMRTTP